MGGPGVVERHGREGEASAVARDDEDLLERGLGLLLERVLDVPFEEGAEELSIVDLAVRLVRDVAVGDDQVLLLRRHVVQVERGVIEQSAEPRDGEAWSSNRERARKGEERAHLATVR